MATALSRGKAGSIALGPNEVLDLSMVLDARLIREYRETAGKLNLSIEDVTRELIRLFVRQSPLADARRGVPLVGFLNLGRIEAGKGGAA